MAVGQEGLSKNSRATPKDLGYHSYAIGSNNIGVVRFDRVILSFVFVMGSIDMLRSVGIESKIQKVSTRKDIERRRERKIMHNLRGY